MLPAGVERIAKIKAIVRTSRREEQPLPDAVTLRVAASTVPRGSRQWREGRRLEVELGRPGNR
jgi:hypothetical protein